VLKYWWYAETDKGAIDGYCPTEGMGSIRKLEGCVVHRLTVFGDLASPLSITIPEGAKVSIFLTAGMDWLQDEGIIVDVEPVQYFGFEMNGKRHLVECGPEGARTVEMAA